MDSIDELWIRVLLKIQAQQAYTTSVVEIILLPLVAINLTTALKILREASNQVNFGILWIKNM